MNLILSERDTQSVERMDDPECDPDELRNTYRQFGRVNELISRWKVIYRREIRPLLKPSGRNTLLDVGFGGGDIPINISRWASEEGFDLQVTAIDPDPRAFDFVRQLERHAGVEFLQCGLSEIDPDSRQFDFVISNHLLHHLSQEELTNILSMSKKLSERQVIFNDIRRDDRAYLLFNLLAPPIFSSSFITEDGRTSIRRSYTSGELRQTVPEDWEVHSLFPFRLLLMYRHA